MGITIAIENDLKYSVEAVFQLKGGFRLTTPRSIAAGDTWKKTDKVYRLWALLIQSPSYSLFLVVKFL